MADGSAPSPSAGDETTGPRRPFVLSWRREVLPPVAAAAIVVFLLDLLLNPPGSGLEIVGRAIGFPLGAALAVAIGWWLGTQTWPKRGRRLARYMLRRAVQGRRPQLVFLSDRPDFRPTTSRRVIEVVGFSAGTSVILASIFIFAGLRAPAAVSALAASFTLIALWGSFLIVPYWAFARLGLRQVDVVRWLVQPLSHRYAGRLRLSNGALLLIALGALLNVAIRAGLTNDEALVRSFLTLAQVVASVLIVAASGVAHYSVRERALLKELETEALAMGIRDARGMSDGDFLPRVPMVR